MSAITIENDLVHYEVLGRGRPVILIHGWLGSWRYWVPAMQQLSMKYRTYALDLWGFGDSGKDPRRYNFDSQVMLLDQFMEKLGITKAALIGHDLGAAVSIGYAAKHPDRVPRLLAVSPPLFRMAPRSIPLTNNPAPLPSPASAPTPERLATGSIPAIAGSVVDDLQAEIEAEAETMPFRSEEMKARIRAALERRQAEKAAAVPEANAPKTPDAATSAPKSPREAAIPPVDDQPTGPMVAVTLPPAGTPADVPAVPKPGPASDGQVQQANPLREHLQITDPTVLLERHVAAGADQEKLKAEVVKADRVSIAVSVDSFANVDTLRDLRSLPMPIVTLYGTNDTFLPEPDAAMLAMLKEGRTTFHSLGIEGARHFPMLENIADFTRLLLDFLEVSDVTKLEIKKIWERRVR
ncbi:MAG TPA: alpha/beta fold hydrolase [Aggregatilineaceae bacterium]|nr:alpha/beta fold hydrolase [Aggregatilineaceae bacterium]